MAKIEHINLIINGRVQGVGYRYWLQKQAKELEICGYAKNMSNGTVYIEAEGTEDKLIQFVKACYKGPNLAKVTSVEFSIDLPKYYINFEIVR